MSNQQIATALLNGVTPRFPKLIKTLNQLLDQKEDLCGTSLKKIGEHVKGFDSLERFATSDNYSWFWILKFIVQEEEVNIAIPWFQDWKRTDDSRLDRSVAIYTNDNISDVQLEQLINNLLMEISNS